MFLHAGWGFNYESQINTSMTNCKHKLRTPRGYADSCIKLWLKLTRKTRFVWKEKSFDIVLVLFLQLAQIVITMFINEIKNEV